MIDVDGGRAVQHSDPVDGQHRRVEVVAELTAPHLGLPAIEVAGVLAATGR